MSSSALRLEAGDVVSVKSSSEITYEGNRDRFRAQDEVVVTKVYRKDFYDGYCRFTGELCKDLNAADVQEVVNKGQLVTKTGTKVYLNKAKYQGSGWPTAHKEGLVVKSIDVGAHPHDTMLHVKPVKGSWSMKVPLTHVEAVAIASGGRKRKKPSEATAVQQNERTEREPRPSPPLHEPSSVMSLRTPLTLAATADAAPSSPPPPPLFPNPAAAPKPPENKFEKKRRLLQKSHDAGTIDRQTYLQLVRETFDAQVDL